nr:hypothetical protein CFP56_20252 [Quercus suber]
MADFNWRTINVDLLDAESASNFDLTTLTPAVQPVSTTDVQTLSGQIRQLARGGNAEGALRGALENAPYGADEQGKVWYLKSQCSRGETNSLRSDTAGSTSCCGHRGMGQGHPSSGAKSASHGTGFSQAGGRNFGGGEGGGQAMSVFLSWHEKLVEMVGPGSIVRVMSDRRTVDHSRQNLCTTGRHIVIDGSCCVCPESAKLPDPVHEASPAVTRPIPNFRFSIGLSLAQFARHVELSRAACSYTFVASRRRWIDQAYSYHDIGMRSSEWAYDSRLPT